LSTQIKKDLKQKGFIYIKEKFPGSRFIEEVSNHRFNAAIVFEYNNNKYFLKTSNTASFTLEPEYFFLDKAKHLGFVPQVIEYDKEQNILIVEYIEGVFYKLFEKAPLKVFATMGELLAKIHSVNIRSAGKLSENKFSHRNNVHFTKNLFYDLINDVRFIEKIDDDNFLNKFDQLLNDYPIQKNVLTHGDYHINNLIFGEDKTYIVDSSVYKSNDKHMDLGIANNFILSRDQGEKEWNEFISAYKSNAIDNDIEMNLAKIHSTLFDLRAARRDHNRGKSIETEIKRVKDSLVYSL
jgi:tRNA A-37 threonylcarbamoyl transferase component Bud32